MANKGWTDGGGGGESVSSTTRTTGVGTQCSDAEPFMRGSQLEQVLWGEIYNLIDSAKYPLRAEKGGPLVVNHLHIRKVYTTGPKKGDFRPKSYLIGRQVATPEGMSGHHLPRMTHYRNGTIIPFTRMMIDDWCTLFVGDECSGVAQTTIDKATDLEMHRSGRLIVERLEPLDTPAPSTDASAPAVGAAATTIFEGARVIAGDGSAPIENAALVVTVHERHLAAKVCPWTSYSQLSRAVGASRSDCLHK